MCPIYNNKHVCVCVCFLLLVQCCRLNFFSPRLCFSGYFSRTERPRNKCTELWRTNRVNCPSPKCQASNLHTKRKKTTGSCNKNKTTKKETERNEVGTMGRRVGRGFLNELFKSSGTFQCVRTAIRTSHKQTSAMKHTPRTTGNVIRVSLSLLSSKRIR